MHLLNRRRLLRNFTLGAAGLWVPGAFADALTLTPKQTEGPFYPVDLPLDTDNDLIGLNDGLTPALGNITHLTGRVSDAKGEPKVACPLHKKTFSLKTGDCLTGEPYSIDTFPVRVVGEDVELFLPPPGRLADVPAVEQRRCNGGCHASCAGREAASVTA